MTEPLTGPADMRAWRIEQGLSQTDAAALFGVKQTVQSQREGGERGVPLGDALIIQAVTRGKVRATSFGHSPEAVAQALAAAQFVDGAVDAHAVAPDVSSATTTAIDGTPPLRSERVRSSKTARRGGSAAA